MTIVTAFVRRHPVLAYFALTFIISWGGIVLAVGPRGLPLTAEEFGTLPALALLAVLAGPSVAGILLTGVVSGKVGYRDLLARITRWRVSVRWYAVALLTAPLSMVAVLIVLSLFSREFLPVTDDIVTLLLSGVAAGLMVGFFEELGWTGFAIPRLKLRYSVLATGFIVGVVWGAWHFLLFWESGSFAGTLLLALLLARLFAWLPAYRMLMVWVYDRTDSLLLVILMHVSLVVSQLAIMEPLALSDVPLLTSILVWAVALWVIVAAVTVTTSGQLSRQPLRTRAA